LGLWFLGEETREREKLEARNGQRPLDDGEASLAKEAHQNTRMQGNKNLGEDPTAVNK
jgi:hypothetical protein